MTKNWALGVEERETDFLITSAENLPPLEQQDDIIFEYNQGASNDCTIYASFGALSDLKNYEFNTNEIYDMNELSYNRWRKRGSGWRTRMAVGTVKDWWNANNPTRMVAYYKVYLTNTELIKEILEKNYTLVVTYRWNCRYNADFLMDWVLDEVEFWKPTYWHAVGLINGRRIKDSSKGRKWVKVENTNIYKIKNEMARLVETGVYYDAAYLIVPVESEARLEELKRLSQFKVLVEENIKNNSEMRHLTNSQEYKDRLHKTNNELRKKLDDIQIEFNKLS